VDLVSIQFDIGKEIPLTEGGEGIIYEYKEKIIKVYKPGIDKNKKQRKIQLLMKKALPKEVVCPLELVVDKKGEFIGYSMDKVEGEEIRKLANKKFTTVNNITTKDIIQILVKVQTILEQLHKDQIYIGDLNDRNILFDKDNNIYWIDCDSWSIETENCQMAMVLFCDPRLQSNNFNQETDIYAFYILAWKLLTRMHPFGGTMVPDMNIVERMKKGISVIGHTGIIIPKVVKSWKIFSPNYVERSKRIFELGERKFGRELEEMAENLKYCKKDKEYYYGNYTSCPLCNQYAQIQKKPIIKEESNGLYCMPLFQKENIKVMVNEFSYLDKEGYIIDIRNKKKVKYQYGIKYYFTEKGYQIEEKKGNIIIYSNRIYQVEKKYKSDIIVEENHIYYISRQHTFMDITVLESGNSIKPVCKCSNRAYFKVESGQYCIVNICHGRLVFHRNGRNTELEYQDRIQNCGIHYDNLTRKWLIILENERGSFLTCILGENGIEYQDNQISYSCNLEHICISASILYIPLEGKIRGYSYQKSTYKDFICEIIVESSKLMKQKNKFLVINEENVYQVGK